MYTARYTPVNYRSSRLPILLLAVLPLAVLAAEVDIDPLTNNTDENADDVHITFNCAPGELTESDPGFRKETDTNPVTLKAKRGVVVAPGGTLELTFKHNCNPPPKVRSYYWTSDGKKIGSTVSLVSHSSDNGITVISVPAEGGTLNYSLPAGIQAGDTISGTVRAIPDHPDVAVSSISGVVLADQEISGTSGEQWTIAVPSAIGAVSFLLKGDAGAPVTLPVEGTGAGVAAEFDFPGIAQAGKPAQIAGPFDGRLGSTNIDIGGEPVDLIAESPRGVFFTAPAAHLGVSELKLTEAGATSTVQIRVLGVNLSAGKLNLVSGEATELNVAVTGLSGLDIPVDLRISNTSPGFIHLEGGETQTVRITPGDVPKGEDAYARSFRLVGVQPGSFDIHAEVAEGK